MRARVAQEFQPVGFGPAMRQLMTKYNPRGIVLHPPRGDEAFPCTAFRGFRNRIFLEVNVKSRPRIARHHALADPLLERLFGSRIDIVRAGILWCRPALFDGDQVIGT